MYLLGAYELSVGACAMGFSDSREYRERGGNDRQTPKVGRRQRGTHGVGTRAVVEPDAQGRGGLVQGRPGSETVRGTGRVGKRRAGFTKNGGRVCDATATT